MEDEAHNIVHTLCEEYRDSPLLMNKLIVHLRHNLPTLLLNHKHTIETKDMEKKRIVTNIDNLVQSFVNKNMYYYSKKNNTFIYYDRKSYHIVDADTIHTCIYDMCTLQPLSTSLKIQVRNSIIRFIKNRNINQTVPESGTIQRVLKLLTSNGITKNEAKYFFTVVGETIKKTTNLLYYVPPALKHFINIIAYACFVGFGCETHRFKYKYRDPNPFSDCRRLYFMRSIESYKPKFDESFDMVCVSLYYARRYISGDEFLKKDTDLFTHVNYLKEQVCLENIINDFVNCNLEKTNSEDTLTMRNMLFLWKGYCDQCAIPYVATRTQLHNAISKTFLYNSEYDYFIGVTSKFMPEVNAFLSFWNDSVLHTDDDIEYEIEEICALFKQYGAKNANETYILKLLRHYFNDTLTIEHDKFIYGIQMKQWNKIDDISNILREIDCSKGSDSVYQQYESYCKKNKKMIASKRFFEKVYFEIMKIT